MCAYACVCVQMEYNREQREVLLALAKVEMKRQQTRAQVKEVSSRCQSIGACTAIWSSIDTLLCSGGRF